MVVPVPVGAASFREVDVRGHKGLLVTANEKTAHDQMVLWTEGDQVYALIGNLQDMDLMQMAGSLR